MNLMVNNRRIKENFMKGFNPFNPRIWSLTRYNKNIQCLRNVAVFWRTIVILVTPLILLPLILVIKKPEASCAYALILMAVYWITEAIPLPITALLPLVLFPLLGLVTGNVVASKYIAEASCAYALILMAVYWITEAIPLPITALLPLVLFPLLGLVTGNVVASKYIAGSSITFLGGMIMALAVEKSQLHRRLALKLLLIVGSKPSSIALGFILPTWFLSLWISNTAATAMMITVVQSVIERLREGLEKNNEKRKQLVAENKGFCSDYDAVQSTYFGSGNYKKASIDPANKEIQQKASSATITTTTTTTTSSSSSSSDDDIYISGLSGSKAAKDMDTDSEEERQLRQFSRMLCLIIAYSSNIGGLATLTGTPTNLLVAELANQVFESHGQPAPLSYATWLMYGLPNSLLCLLLMWLWLQLYFMSYRSFCCCCSRYKTGEGEDVGIGEMVKREYQQLGSITFYEISAAVFLFIMVVLWFVRDPGFSPGYGNLFKSGYVNDGVPAMLISILLFVFPSKLPTFSCIKGNSVSVPALLDWTTVSTKLPWGPIVILGGGYALAHACQISGLSDLLGSQLKILQNLPPWVMVLLITTLVTFFTEITSNAAVISIINPILVAMSSELSINPLYLMLPAGMAATCAFMLPVATPPNAIVFSYGHLKVLHMVKAGFILNILCIVVITVGVHTWGMAIFHLNVLPWDSVTLNNTDTSALNYTSPTP